MLKTFNISRAFYLCMALIILTASASASAQPLASNPHIQVTGEGTVAIAADMAVLTLTVTRDAKTARDALNTNSEAMAEILTAMQEAGIAEKDLQTSNFSIQPKYHYPKRNSNTEDNAPTIVGYTVRNSLSVRVRDLKKVGSILDQSVSLGVNEGGNITFTNNDPSTALAQARTLAVHNALEKAKTLAEAAGVGVGKILEMSEHGSSQRPMPMAKTRMAAVQYDEAVPVASGENSYRVSVSISFEIKQ
jgi:uncharacterized protein YggE